MSEKIGIYEALAAITSELGAITKDKRCTQGANFAYRGIDDVYNALNPLLGKHGVFVLPSAGERTTEGRTTKNGSYMEVVTVKMTYRFCHKDGSFVECATIGEAMDSGDKATNKAMSVAHKYAVLQTFCVPTEDLQLDDPDREAHQLAPREIKQVREKAKESNPNPPTEAQMKALNTLLSKQFGKDRVAKLKEMEAFTERKLTSCLDLTKDEVSNYLDAMTAHIEQRKTINRLIEKAEQYTPASESYGPEEAY